MLDLISTSGNNPLFQSEDLKSCHNLFYSQSWENPNTGQFYQYFLRVGEIFMLKYPMLPALQ